MQNKKVRNATPTTYKGKKFRSKLELFTYQKLIENGIKEFDHERKFILQKAFEYQGEKIRPITYSPDFSQIWYDADPIHVYGWIIEVKGYANDVWPMKWKMFKKHLDDNLYDGNLYVVKNQKQALAAIADIKQKYYD